MYLKSTNRFRQCQIIWQATAAEGMQTYSVAEHCSLQNTAGRSLLRRCCWAEVVAERKSCDNRQRDCGCRNRCCSAAPRRSSTTVVADCTWPSCCCYHRNYSSMICHHLVACCDTDQQIGHHRSPSCRKSVKHRRPTRSPHFRRISSHLRC